MTTSTHSQLGWTEKGGHVSVGAGGRREPHPPRRPPQGGPLHHLPLRGDKIRAIKAWLVERSGMKAPGRSFFLSEQRKPLHRSTVHLLLHKYGKKAKQTVAVHPHILRHACGFALADQGVDTGLIQGYLGHRNIQHTVSYTTTNPARFKKLCRLLAGRNKKPRWLAGPWNDCPERRDQPMAVITSGHLLSLIRLRSLRL
jgi:integrase